MKKILSILSLLFTGCHSSTPEAASPPKEIPSSSLYLSVSDGENSRDSNQSTYRCQLDKRTLKYYGPYGGSTGKCIRGQCPHKEIVFQISEEQFTQLLDVIKTTNLPSDFKEEGDITHNGYYMSLSFTHNMSKESSNIVISGMKRLRGHKEVELISQQGMALAEKIKPIQKLLTQFAQNKQKDFH